MSLANTIEQQINSYNSSGYEMKLIDFLPSPQNMSSKKAYRLDVCALYIELRGANNLDFAQWENSIQLIHQITFDPIYQIISEYDGQIVSTPGNGILALWISSKSNINKAVEAALGINWFLKVKCKSEEKYPHFDFGIAIHHGSALAVKVQKPGASFDEEDIKYISPVINITQSMSNQLSQPKTIGISQDVYERLYDDAVTVKKSFVLIPYQKNIWEDGKIKFNENTYKIKTSSHHMNLEDNSIAEK